MTTMHENHRSRRALLQAAAFSPLASLAALAPAFSHAQGTWPSQQIRLVVPFPAGGNTDIVARILAKTMAADLGQAVVIDNKAGAGGNIGAAQVAKEQADIAMAQAAVKARLRAEVEANKKKRDEIARFMR